MIMRKHCFKSLTTEYPCNSSISSSFVFLHSSFSKLIEGCFTLCNFASDSSKDFFPFLAVAVKTNSSFLHDPLYIIQVTGCYVKTVHKWYLFDNYLCYMQYSFQVQPRASLNYLHPELVRTTSMSEDNDARQILCSLSC